MVDYSNFDRLMEAANHSKNSAMEAENHVKHGASSKSLTSGRNLHILFFLTLVLSVGIISCDKSDEPIAERERLLVDKIYNYNNDLVAEYFYDSKYRLTKISVTEHLGNDYKQEWAAYTDEFEYLNERVSKIVHKDVSNNMFNYETLIVYDLQGQLIRSEVHMDGQNFPRNYRYENGRFVGFPSKNDGSFFYSDTIVYDNSGNVDKHIHIHPEIDFHGNPIPGTTRRDVYLYEYDEKPKPDFGLDYLFVYQPLPHLGTETGYARELSKNNLTKYVNSGTTWSYTYNEFGLPETIETKWKDIETEEPMILRITYKHIK